MTPTWPEFEELASRSNLIPVSEVIHFDWETPISAFRKIDDGEYSFLLESVEGGEKWGRYSILGSAPARIFRSRGNEFEVLSGGEVEYRGVAADPLRALKGLLQTYRPAANGGLPRFYGGAVGYAGYDLVRSFERIPNRLAADESLYDCLFMITDTLLVFDNLKHKINVICNVPLDREQSLRRAYENAGKKIRNMISRLQSPLPQYPRQRSAGAPARAGRLSSNLAPEEFMERVRKAREYIHAGDAIQVVLSQRFSADLGCEPFDIYRALRSINPSPYLFYLKMGPEILLGASPEVMVRLEEEQIELRPLAGTRRRGQTPAKDAALEKELLADEKERAEHIMLVDLGRNDVGRVSRTGSVEVTELMGVERYSHVMHIVSHVRGRIAPGKDAFDVFRAAFPAGTVSGAPKIRAMEIIEELEPARRGTYAGAAGYFGFSGNMDTCIAIRSIFIKGGRAFLQVGAGIVADSDPEKEYRETLNKAQAILRAIRQAEEGLE